MTKPDDIPQDVWDAAGALKSAFHTIGSGNLTEFAARAIMAERERCLSAMTLKAPSILGPNDWPNYVVGPVEIPRR